MNDTKTLFSLFRDYAKTKNYALALHELLNYFLMPFKVYETPEEKGTSLDYLATHPQANLIFPILEELGTLSEGFADPLGHLYELLISKGEKGQFFTPEHVADLMAAITIPENTPPGNRVYDPACGSGRMLLAAAKLNRHFHFYGADVDGLCAKITAVNFLLQSLTGEVAHINSLTNEFYGGYKIGTVLRDGFHMPCYLPIDDRVDSYIWNVTRTSGKKREFDTPFNPVSTGPITGTQGDLFEQP